MVACLWQTAASTLTVTTLEPCKLLVLERRRFRKVMALMPNLREQIRSYSVLRRGMIEAMLAANAVGEEVAAMSRPLRADNRIEISREVAATRIQRFARGRMARHRVDAIRCHAALAGRSVGRNTSVGLIHAASGASRPSL